LDAGLVPDIAQNVRDGVNDPSRPGILTETYGNSENRSGIGRIERLGSATLFSKLTK